MILDGIKSEGKKLVDEYMADNGKFDKALTLAFLGPSKGLTTSATKDIALQNALDYAKNTDIWARVEQIRNSGQFDGQIPKDMDPEMFYFQKAAEQIIYKCSKLQMLTQVMLKHDLHKVILTL